jgi:hypothetical protein
MLFKKEPKRSKYFAHGKGYLLTNEWVALGTFDKGEPKGEFLMAFKDGKNYGKVTGQEGLDDQAKKNVMKQFNLTE